MLSHVAFLVTMRGRCPACDKAIKRQLKDTKAIDEAACLRIYHEISRFNKRPRCREIAGHSGAHLFRGYAIAKLGVDGQSTTKDVLDAWLKSGPDISDDDLEQT